VGGDVFSTLVLRRRAGGARRPGAHTAPSEPPQPPSPQQHAAMRSLGFTLILLSILLPILAHKNVLSTALTLSPVLLAVVVVSTRRLIGALHPKQQQDFFWCFLVACLVAMLGMGLIDEQIKTKEAPLGIMSFQQAFTPEKAAAILDAWTHKQKIWVGFSLGADHLLMPLYAFTIALGCMVVGTGAEVAIDMASAQFVAAILDFLEGLFCFSMLMSDGPVNPQISLGAGVCCTLRYILIFAGTLYIAMMYGLQRMRPNARFD
jgi:hypothetical protein